MVGDDFGFHAPHQAQLLAYQAAEWGGFGFGVVGTQIFMANFFITLSYLRVISGAPLFLPSGSRNCRKA
jgi:hypothetical protein